jgi:hypothetical protein
VRSKKNGNSGFAHVTAYNVRSLLIKVKQKKELLDKKFQELVLGRNVRPCIPESRVPG